MCSQKKRVNRRRGLAYDSPMTDECLFPATEMPDGDGWRVLWPEPAAVLTALGAEAGMTALDLCRGDGYFTAPLSRIGGPKGRVFAVDPDPAMLARAGAHVAEAGLAQGVADALAPGGRFAVVNWHARRREETPVLGQPRGPATDMRLTPEATRALVEPAGLAFDGVVELSPYHYGALFRTPEA